jgi:hypothetical protein
MADQADVENALVSLVATAVYPNGTGQVSAVIGAAGAAVCRVYRGAPNGPALEADLAQGVMHATVFAADTPVKNTTRFPRSWQVVARVPDTLAVTTHGSSASFAGTCAAGQLAGIAVDGAIFPYAVQARDTPPTVASNLAAMLRAAGWLVDYSASALTVPAAQLFTARVVAGGMALQEIKRQVEAFRISLWCGDPSTRDAAAAVIDPALATPNFIALADGSCGHLTYAGGSTTDTGADAALYRRDLIYTVEYPTTLMATTPAMLFGVGSIEANGEFIAGISG